MPTYWTYILASRSRVLYVGVTGNLIDRIAEHRRGRGRHFTAKYGITRLVHAEPTRYVNNAIAREKQLKSWTRARKIELIEAGNPEWRDLMDGR
jgi:putative endonuclease